MSCCVLGKQCLALDACSKQGNPDHPPGVYDCKKKIAHIVCCKKDGSSCTRYTTFNRMSFKKKCSKKVTWKKANKVCKKMGKRLCNGQTELNKCCATGCNFDRRLAWVQ